MGSLPASAGSRQAVTDRCLVTGTLGPARAQKDANMMRPTGELRAQFDRKSQRVVFRHQVASELLRSSIGQTSDWSAEPATVARPTDQDQDLDGLRRLAQGKCIRLKRSSSA